MFSSQLEIICRLISVFQNIKPLTMSQKRLLFPVNISGCSSGVFPSLFNPETKTHVHMQPNVQEA